MNVRIIAHAYSVVLRRLCRHKYTYTTHSHRDKMRLYVMRRRSRAGMQYA